MLKEIIISMFIMIGFIMLGLGITSMYEQNGWEKDSMRLHWSIMEEDNVTEFKEKCNKMHLRMKDKAYDSQNMAKEYIYILEEIAEKDIDRDDMITYKSRLQRNERFGHFYGDNSWMFWMGLLITTFFITLAVACSDW